MSLYSLQSWRRGKKEYVAVSRFSLNSSRVTAKEKETDRWRKRRRSGGAVSSPSRFFLFRAALVAVNCTIVRKLARRISASGIIARPRRGVACRARETSRGIIKVARLGRSREPSSHVKALKKKKKNCTSSRHYAPSRASCRRYAPSPGFREGDPPSAPRAFEEFLSSTRRAPPPFYFRTRAADATRDPDINRHPSRVLIDFQGVAQIHRLFVSCNLKRSFRATNEAHNYTILICTNTYRSLPLLGSLNNYTVISSRTQREASSSPRRQESRIATARLAPVIAISARCRRVSTRIPDLCWYSLRAGTVRHVEERFRIADELVHVSFAGDLLHYAFLVVIS
ncbi:hypothetical protein PUN28_001404 [Cardiocondyla obscurior]|uniref:Uncharacterized protein n=1 Tax=Cardiocondyla obscurior TaxID=286306 RepID=A0AAW2H4U5_9HYME